MSETKPLDKAKYQPYFLSTITKYNLMKFNQGDVNLLFSIGCKPDDLIMPDDDETENIALDNLIFTNPNFNPLDSHNLTATFYNSITNSLHIENEDIDAYVDKFIKAFVKFAKVYANYHKGHRFIVYSKLLTKNINPEELKDCAVVIQKPSFPKATDADIPTKQADHNALIDSLESKDTSESIDEYIKYFKSKEDVYKESVVIDNNVITLMENFVRIFNQTSNSFIRENVKINVNTLPEFRCITFKTTNINEIANNYFNNSSAIAMNTIVTEINRTLPKAIMQPNIREATNFVIDARYNKPVNEFILRFGASKPITDKVTVNGITISEVADICNYAVKLNKLEYLASESCLKDALSNHRKIRPYKEMVDRFNSEVKLYHEDFINAGVYFPKGKIIQFENALKNLTEKVTAFAEMASHKPDPINNDTMIQHEAYSPSRIINPNRNVKKYAEAVPNIKSAYVSMIDKVKSVKEAFYPGIDKHDWKETPSEWFDESSKNIYSFRLGNERFGRGCITICEFDNPTYDYLINSVVETCKYLIPHKYSTENPMSEFTFDIAVRDKKFGKTIELISEAFLLK